MSNFGNMLIRTGAMIVGSYFGGPIGAIAAYTAASYLFPMDYEGERPEFSDYPLQSSTKGQPVTVLIGTKEIAGNIIYLGPEDPYYIKQESGGKGGGDSSTSYEARYRRSFLIALCEGPASVIRCYKGKEEIDLTDFTQFHGDGNDGLSDLIGEDWTDYKNVCCAWFEDYELGNSPSLPNFVFECSSEYYGLKSYCIVGDDLYMIPDKGITLDAAPATNEGSGLTGLPCSFHPFKAGQKIKIGGTSTCDSGNGYIIDSVTDTHIIIQKSYSAETFSGDECIVQFQQNLLEDYGYGHGCIVGDYYYVPINYNADYQTCIIRIKLSTLEVESDWADAPATYGWYSGQVGMNAKPSADGLYIFLQTLDSEILYKIRISDGAIVWEFYYHYGHSDNYGLAVKSDGDCFIAGVRDEYEYGRRKPVRVKAGSDGTFGSVAFLDPPGTGGASNTGTYCCALVEDILVEGALLPVSLIAFGGGQSNSGSTYYKYPLVIFDADDEGGGGTPPYSDTVSRELMKWDFGTGGSGDDIYQMFWYGGFLYCRSNTVNYEGEDKKIWKFKVTASIGALGDVSYDLSLVASAQVTYGDSMWIGNDGNIWVARTQTYGGDDFLVVLDKDDLSEIATYKTHELTSVSNSIITSAEYVTNYKITDPAHDEYPPDIIHALLTDPRKGLGLPESLLNLETFTDELVYCQANDIKMSLALTDQKPMADWLQYICTHFMGYLYESNGKICLGSMRPRDSVFSIIQDDLVREGDDPPVKIKPRDYSETYNRIEAIWSDRDNRYRETPVPAFDEVDQRISGFLRHKTVDLKGFHDPDLAARMAWLNFINAMYRFKTYAFSVSYKHLAIEVGDVGTLDDGNRVSNQTVRIISINLSKDGKNIQIEAVEDITALYPTLTNYTAQQSLRQATPTVTLASGSVGFRESTTEAKLMLAITPGGAQTNGWYIYRSYDNISYDLVGRATIDGVTGGDANSVGTLQTNLPAHTAVVHRKDEAFDVSIGTVTDLDTAVTDESFFNNRKLAKIGDEIIAYRDCVESATEGTWQVSNLIRGLFGTEPAAHLAGEIFQTLDTSFTYALTESDIGKTLYFKVVSFYGSKVQSVSEVSAASVQVQGLSQRPFAASLPRLQADENDIAEAEYSGSSFTLYWNLPGTKGTGFNQGGFDLNDAYPVWRYGDPESQLVGGDGAPYGHFLADAELQAIDLVFEQTDGTIIGQRSVDPTADSEVISKADDLGGNSQAVIKVYPRRSYRAAKAAEILVTGV